MKATALRLAAIWVLALMAIGCESGGVSKNLSRREAKSLVADAIQDDENSDRESAAVSSHAGWILGDGVWLAVFPVQFAEQRLVTRGRDVLPVLWSIADDQQEDIAVRRKAAAIAGNLDPRRCAVWFGSHGAKNNIELVEVIQEILPLPAEMVVPMFHDPNLQRWLLHEVGDGRGYEALLLWSLDRLLEPNLPVQNGGPHAADARIVRWLDRLYDEPADSLLALSVPEAAAFRRREMEKGYDPLALFRRAPYLSGGLLKRAIERAYDSGGDREQCTALMRCVEGDSLGIGNRNWRSRLEAWYGASREKLHFDPRMNKLLVR